MSLYRQIISDATKVTDIKELRVIEEVMRVERPTLDSLPLGSLKALARRAQKALGDPELRKLYDVDPS